MKAVYFLLLGIVIPQLLFAQPGNDYTQYHKNIIKAEYEFFIKNNPGKGLELFDNTFKSYDFVFVDDCIEAFQLALVQKRDDYAMRFIKKALDNGFELKLLSLLNYSCVHDLYAGEDTSEVTVYKPFIAKNETQLVAYAKTVYGKYLQRIDKNLLAAIIKRHVEEQAFKGNVKELLTNKRNPKEDFYRINNDNMRFVDSLGSKGIFLGERNLGIYTNNFVKELKLPYSIESYAASLMRSYGLPSNTYIPVIKEEEYFDACALFIIYYHKMGSYKILGKYKDTAIKQGYLHPREYARLKFNFENAAKADSQLYLAPGATNITKRVLADELRASALLPSLNIDSAKHEYGHRHRLHLFFGFNNTAR